MNALPWGLLWYDSGPRPLEDKVEDASRRYQEKYGEQPTVCFVRDTQGIQDVGKCEIVSDGAVLEHHLWIGVA